MHGSVRQSYDYVRHKLQHARKLWACFFQTFGTRPFGRETLRPKVWGIGEGMGCGRNVGSAR